MNDMTLNTTDATAVDSAAVVQTAIERFMFGAKCLQKAMTKASGSDETLFNQRLEIQQLRDDVSKALAGDGDFDAASRAFKAANNKLDKLIDARDATLKDAKAGIDALRRALDAVADDLRDLED